MNIVKASAEIVYPNVKDPEVVKDMYLNFEEAGRTCYASSMKEDGTAKFLRKIIENEHLTVIEHAVVTVKFVVDRGVSHEIVRHRIASFSQQSTRYCNYSHEKFGSAISVIEPFIMENEYDGPEWIETFIDEWMNAMTQCEDSYMKMVNAGVPPEWARTVLPNSTKTELRMTANLREWRHFFNLRAAGTTGKPHPQMKEVAVQLLKEFQRYMPEIFGDIEVEA